MTNVYFVRHAEPDFSIKEDSIRPLSTRGSEASKKVTKALLDKKIAAVYSSPYLRAVDTVKDLAENLGFEIKCDDGFRERCNGKWVEDFKTYSKNQWDDFDFALEDGECLREVQARNISSLHKVLMSNRDKNIVIGSHGTALGTVINHYNPDFGYDHFWGIIDKMPYILCFQFEELELKNIIEIEF